MASGLLSQKSQLGEVVSRYLLRQGSPLQLVPLSISLWLVLDGSGGLYPLSKDNAGAVKDPPMLVRPCCHHRDLATITVCHSMT